MKKSTMSATSAILLTLAYFGIMLLYTFVDITIWRKLLPAYAELLNILTIVICVTGFLLFLKHKGIDIKIFCNTTFSGVLMAIACSALLFLILDGFLDPIFEIAFPTSEQAYQEMIQSLTKSPLTSFLQVCVVAPIIEEMLMRKVILGGLRVQYSFPVALLISSLLFACLHFNMLQTISAFVCGILLGLLYVKTNSVFCCMLAHSLYNLASFIVIMRVAL